jgi:hypothetical protein
LVLKTIFQVLFLNYGDDFYQHCALPISNILQKLLLYG